MEREKRQAVKQAVQTFVIEGEEISGLTPWDCRILQRLEALRQEGVDPLAADIAREFYSTRDPLPVVMGNFNSAIQRLRGRLRSSGSDWYVFKEEGRFILDKYEEASAPAAIEAPPATIVVKTETALPAEIKGLYTQIVMMIPEGHLAYWIGKGYIDPQDYRKQVEQLAEYALALDQGKIDQVNPLSIVGQPSSKKTELAQERLRQLVVSSLDPSLKPSTRLSRLSRGVNELSDYLGASGFDQTRQAIDQLSDVERGLIIANASTSLLERLDYLDLDECDEHKLAAYIRNATFENSPETIDEQYEMLLTAALERADDQLEIAKVIEILTRLPYWKFILEKMLESAEYGDFRRLLLQFFSRSGLTRNLCVYIQQQLDLEIDKDHRPVSKKRNIDLA